ncbi:DMT family transporter [Oceanospirillum sp.]|uniref:DMT family transporter n=1 Tax=Oceanospirillum sp. TaxID=2021254 RepID=UPI003A8E4F03
MIIRSSRLAFILVFLISLIWGTEFVLIDLAVAELPTHTFNAIRFALAALSLLPLLYFSKEKVRSDQLKKLLLTAPVLGAMLFIGFYAQTEGLRFTSVSNAGFITALSVPLVPVLGLLLFRQKVRLMVWLGVSLATLGLYLLTMGGAAYVYNKGDLLVLICAFGFAAHIVLTGHWVGNMPVITLSIIQLLAVSLYSVIGAAMGDHPIFYYAGAAPITGWELFSKPVVIFSVVVASILGTAYAVWAQSACQKLLPSHKIALVFALEPIFAHITAWVVLSEHLGAMGGVGAACIVAAMVISELGDKSHQPEIQALDQTAAPH